MSEVKYKIDMKDTQFLVEYIFILIAQTFL